MQMHIVIGTSRLYVSISLSIHNQVALANTHIWQNQCNGQISPTWYCASRNEIFYSIPSFEYTQTLVSDSASWAIDYLLIVRLYLNLRRRCRLTSATDNEGFGLTNRSTTDFSLLQADTIDCLIRVPIRGNYGRATCEAHSLSFEF